MAPVHERLNVVVVGSGPAGGAAALWARKFGLNVLVLEAARFPRPRPGEALIPAVEGLLRELGLGERLDAAGFVRFPGNRLHWGGQERVFHYGNGAAPLQGWQIPRRDLDAMLLEEAARQGALVLQPCAARGLFASRRRVEGVVTTRGAFRSDFVVDAGGGAHWLAGKLKVPVKTWSPPLHSTFGYAHGSRPEELPLVEADEAGWSWTSRVGPEHWQFTRLDFDRVRRPPDWLPERLRGMTPGPPRGGMDSTWREAERLAGPGWFLAGDAAAVFDPVSLQGTMKGLMSGMKAVHAIHRILHEGVPEEEARAGYEDWLRGWYHEELRKLRAFYQLHPAALR